MSGSQKRSCNGKCLCCTLVSILAAILVAVGLIFLIVWLVLRPHALNVYAQSGKLTDFALTNGTTLRYNLTTDVVINNPNNKISFYYEGLAASANYDGERFKWEPLPGFYQPTANNTVLTLTFSGSNSVFLSESGRQWFRSQSSTGVFDVLVKIDGRIKFKVGSSTGGGRSLKIRCPLRLRLQKTGSTAIYFYTKCKSNY